MKELFKVDKNGTKYYREEVPCYRCGGHGIYYIGVCNNQLVPAHPDAGVCYRCNGKGTEIEVTKEYTPEYEAKLEARRFKKIEKELAKQKAEADAKNTKFFEDNGFDSNGDMWIVLGNTYSIKDDLKALGCTFSSRLGWHSNKALDSYPTLKVNVSEIYETNEAGVYIVYIKNDNDIEDRISKANKAIADVNKPDTSNSQYVGSVGNRLELTLTYVGSAKFSVPNFYDRDREDHMYIHNFVDGNGNVFIWKTSTNVHMEVKKPIKGEEGSWYTEYVHPNKNDIVTIKGTVKEHSEYKKIKQTVLTRVKVLGISSGSEKL